MFSSVISFTFAQIVVCHHKQGLICWALHTGSSLEEEAAETDLQLMQVQNASSQVPRRPQACSRTNLEPPNGAILVIGRFVELLHNFVEQPILEGL